VTFYSKTPFRNLSRRDFLKLSALATASPYAFSGCSLKMVRPELRELARKNPGVTEAHLKLMDFYSQTFLLGPPAEKELLDLVAHLFTPEEAEIAQHLPFIYGRTAQSISRKVKRPVDEVEASLARMADEKRTVISMRDEDVRVALAIVANRNPSRVEYPKIKQRPRKYGLMPIIPGTFEFVLMEGKNDEFCRKHGELNEALYNTGYIKNILKDRSLPAARYIPIEETIQAVPAALPSDRLSELIREHNSFGLSVCQCRQSQAYSGHDCGLPRDTCMSTGAFADFLIARGIMRRVDRSEALEKKLKAQESGLVTMSVNIELNQPNISCSCCSCCCLILRSITQFNTPGLIAPPHFRPVRDEGKCVRCGACAEKCPMQAHVMKETGWEYKKERCIGCGICASICPQKALEMKPVKGYRRPSATYMGLGLALLPGYAQDVLFPRY